MGLVKRVLTLREGSIIVVTLVTFAYFAISTSNFATGGSFKALLPYFAPLAMIAAGEVFVMILGEIDLSVGAVYLFTPFIWHVLHHAGIPLYPSIILAVLVAMGIGAINGIFVAYVGIASFVATLGMLFLLDGLALVISHSTPIQVPGTSISGVTSFGQIFGGGTYSELFWAIGIVIILQIVLSFSRWGLYTVSVGSNRLAAAEAGVRTRMITIRNFVLCAGIAGFVGILEVVRVTSATPDPSGSNTILLQVVAAAIIGGTLMTGGDGTIVGAFIGALFLGILTEGLTIKGVSANYLDLYLGIAILIAMTLNTIVRRVRTGAGRA
ncbi:MAG TPA: ABC transporter permease [Solirubrobacteraceae bacterium]|jgi:simple sugar transport system permease protein